MFASNEWGNVYVSDTSGSQYVSSLDHVASSFPFFDFGRVRSLEGIYLANTLANWADPNSSPMLETFISMDNGGEWKPVKPPRKDSQGNPIPCTGVCSFSFLIFDRNVLSIYTLKLECGTALLLCTALTLLSV